MGGSNSKKQDATPNPAAHTSASSSSSSSNAPNPPPRQQPAPAPTSVAPAPAPSAKGGDLKGLFDKYREVSIANGTSEKEDIIEGEAIVSFCKDLGIGVEDPVVLVIAWKINAQMPYQFSRSEFVGGFSALNLLNLKKLQGEIPKWRKFFKEASASEYKPFYNFVFSFSRPEPQSKFIPAEDAAALWRMVLENRWELLDKWATYISDTHKKAVNKDVWTQLYDFTNSVKPDLSDFDENDAWPTAIDEFVDFLKEANKK